MGRYDRKESGKAVQGWRRTAHILKHILVQVTDADADAVFRRINPRPGRVDTGVLVRSTAVLVAGRIYRRYNDDDTAVQKGEY